mmetsp:Transcript_26251/g.84772  ORF Transcript_26251/g.84772 Transcript_26251/m.84772 type:complete len:317 (+) Transcript_26251:594-1544(+)
MTLLARMDQRRGTAGIGHLEQGARLGQQPLGQLQLAGCACLHQPRTAVVIGHIERLPTVRQQLTNVHMTAEASEQQRRVAIAIARPGRTARLNELLGKLKGPGLRGVVQRQVAGAAGRVSRSAMLEKPQGGAGVSKGRGVVQRGVAALVFQLNVGPLVHQPTDRLDPPLASRQHERRATDVVARVDSVAHSGGRDAERPAGRLETAVGTREVKQRMPQAVRHRGRRASHVQDLRCGQIAPEARKAQRGQSSRCRPVDLRLGAVGERRDEPLDHLNRPVDRRLVHRRFARIVGSCEVSTLGVQPLGDYEPSPAARHG